MALTLQAANLVRQKAYHAAGIVSGSVAIAQANYAILKAVFGHIAAVLNNPDLKIVYVDGGATASDGGNTASQVVSDAACNIYAILLKKTGSTATSFKVTNHASTATTDGTQSLGYILTAAGETNLFVFPNGHAMSTGVVYTEDTTATGSTLNLLANRIDGFIIVGA